MYAMKVQVGVGTRVAAIEGVLTALRLQTLPLDDKWKEGNLVPCSGELRVQGLHVHCLDIEGCYWSSTGACSAKNQDAHRQ